MRRYISKVCWVLGLSLCLQGFAWAELPALVSPQWLKAQQDNKKLVILEMQPQQTYVRHHLPNSVRTDYGVWRDTNKKGVRKMLPNREKLAALIGSLGISNDSQVVIVPIGRGAGDMASAARVYWSLFVAGLDDVAILEGGIIGWHRAFGDELLVAGRTEVEPKEFKIKLREDHIMTMEKVRGYLDTGKDIVDARSHDEYIGLIAGRGERVGALPRAINLHYQELMNPEQTALLDKKALKTKFEGLDIPLQGEQVSYCHTGHRTALVWFVSHSVLGNKQARLYDGSTLEWSSTDDQPLVARLDDL